MIFRQILTIALPVALMSLPSYGKKPFTNTNSNNPESSINNVLKLSNLNPQQDAWMKEQFVKLVRHDLDYNISNIISTNQVAQKVLHSINQEIGPYMEEARIENLVNFGRAVPGKEGQFQEILKIANESATFFHFKPEVIKNGHIFVSGDNTLNAYTYSPSMGYLDFVMLDGLIQLFTDNKGNLNLPAIKAVITHELGHVVSNHVLNGMVLQAVFKATGDILIPKDQQIAFREMWKGYSKVMIKNAIGLHDEDHEALTNKLVTIAESSANKLKADFSQEELVQLSHQLMKAVGIKTRAVKPSSAGEIDDMLKAKDFKAAMEKVTRSQEITADWMALIATGPTGLADAMALLAGGKQAKGSAIIKQAQELLNRMTIQELEVRNLEQNDHPGVVFRAASFLTFMNTLNYRIASNPFERSVYFYMLLSKNISDTNLFLETRKSELSMLQKNTLLNNSYSQLAKNLSQAIVETISKEIANSSKTGEEPIYFNRLISLIDKMKSVGGEYGAIASHSALGQTDGLFSNLKKSLEQISLPVADLAKKQIEKLVATPSEQSTKTDFQKALDAARLTNQKTETVRCANLFN